MKGNKKMFAYIITTHRRHGLRRVVSCCPHAIFPFYFDVKSISFVYGCMWLERILYGKYSLDKLSQIIIFALNCNLTLSITQKHIHTEHSTARHIHIDIRYTQSNSNTSENDDDGNAYDKYDAWLGKLKAQWTVCPFQANTLRCEYE